MAEAAAPRSPLASLADALAEARAGDAVLVERPVRTRLNLGWIPRTPTRSPPPVRRWAVRCR